MYVYLIYRIAGIIGGEFNLAYYTVCYKIVKSKTVNNVSHFMIPICHPLCKWRYLGILQKELSCLMKNSVHSYNEKK